MKALKAGVCLLLGFATHVSAGVADFFDIEPVADAGLVFGTWTVGLGAQSRLMEFCIGSANYAEAFSSPPPDLTPTPMQMAYAFGVRSRQANQEFALYLAGDDQQMGNAKLVVSVAFRDVDEPAWMVLIHDRLADDGYLGGFRGCQGRHNAELRLSISANQLAQARAGRYVGLWQAYGQGGHSGLAADSTDFQAEIVVAELVKISGVADIDLGMADPGDDAWGETDFCVYSNDDEANYALSVSSPNQDSRGNFILLGEHDVVPYRIYFQDRSGVDKAVGVRPVQGNGSNTSFLCDGIDNAKITVRVSAEDIAGAKSGSYADTLTILAEPI